VGSGAESWGIGPFTVTTIHTVGDIFFNTLERDDDAEEESEQ
jgi:hypothetical protein